MKDINTSLVTLKTVIDEDGSFTFIITPSITLSSPDTFRWEITFGQGVLYRGVITFKAGESDSRSILKSIDPDEHYQFRVYRVSDNNNAADDELLFQQQSKTTPPSLKDVQPHEAPQQAGVEVKGEQETDITQVNAALVLNKDESTVIEADALLYMHPVDPRAALTYTLTAAPVGGVLFLGDVELGNGDTFTQGDIDAGRLTYRFTAEDNNPTNIVFTVSDGSLTLLDQTLTITPRVVPEVVNPEEDNVIDLSDEMAPQKIDGGDGSDTITGGAGDDQIKGGAGDDEIILNSNAEEDSGADEVLYTFGYDGVGHDGGDVIRGFKRGQDKVTLIVHDSRQFANLEEFLGSLKGADDAFIVTMQWGTDEAGVFYFDGVLLHFKEATSFGGGRVSSPLVQITFDERLDLKGLIGILGGAENVAANFDFTHAAFKNLDEVLPRLFGESSIDFEVVTIIITASGEVAQDDDTAKSATGTLTGGDDNPSTTPPTIKFVGDTDGDGVVEGAYGTMTFDAVTRVWTYTLDEAQVLRVDQQETETFTFTTDRTRFIVTITVNGANDKPTDLQLTEPVQILTVGADLSQGTKVGVLTITDDLSGSNTIILAGADAELFEIRDTSSRLIKELWLKAGVDRSTLDTTVEVTASVEGTGKGDNPDVDQTLTILVLPDVTSDRFTKILGNGIEGTEIGRDDATSSQFLIGGDHRQTINAGIGGDVIFGGQGNDLILLLEQDSDADIVFYRYDGGNNSNESVAYDGADEILNFDLDEDYLVLAHVGNNVHDNAAAFYASIKGINVLVSKIGNITGIRFIFTDRADANQEITLKVSFDEILDVTDRQIDLTAFRADPGSGQPPGIRQPGEGQRAIMSGQEDAAYEVIDSLFGDSLQLINFEDIGFDLSPGDTDVL